MCTVRAAYKAYYISHQVMCDVSHATPFLFDLIAEPDTSDMNVECRLRSAMHSLLAFGSFHYCPGCYGPRPIAMRPVCASQVTGGFLFFHTQK